MKHAAFILILCLVSPGGLAAQDKALPPIEALKQLPVELAADFSDHEDIASPAMPEITKQGALFFYDYKLKQLFKTHAADRKLIPIGRSGEGPQEYVHVKDIYLSKDSVYLIDMKQKLLCFGIDGTYRWETRTGSTYHKIGGIKGETFYLVGNADATMTARFWGLFQWRKGKTRRLLVKMPLFSLQTAAYDMSGKKISGGGSIILAPPVLVMCPEIDTLITAGENRYKIDFHDMHGNLKNSIDYKAPAPQLNEFQKMFGRSVKDKSFAIMDVFYESPYVIVISNYFKDGQPRVDFFTIDGELHKSFLMPEKVDSQESLYSSSNRTAEFSKGYLLYKDPETVGFKVYRLKTT